MEPIGPSFDWHLVEACAPQQDLDAVVTKTQAGCLGGLLVDLVPNVS
jgi:hypothetical protein